MLEGAFLEVRSTPLARVTFVGKNVRLFVGGGLRQAPPQRVLFQPDLSSSRQTRHASGHLQSPQPVATTSAASYLSNASSNPNSMSFSIANYEPRPQMPLTLRGVITPGNNPTLFKERQRISREARAGKLGTSAPSYKGMMLPGSKFYTRPREGINS